MMPGLLLRDGRPWGTRGPVDLGGRLVLPGLVEAHCHLDKTLHGGPWRPGPRWPTGSPTNASTARSSGCPTRPGVSALLETMAAAGTTHVRTHTDVCSGTGLTGVEVVRDAAARPAGRITVEQVAFPRSGILTDPGTGRRAGGSGHHDHHGGDLRLPGPAGEEAARSRGERGDLWSPYGSGDLLDRAMHLA
jgi:cytosine deaminase